MNNPIHLPEENLNPLLEKRLAKYFSRAGLPNHWWKAWAKELQYCQRCGGRVAWKMVPAEGRRRFLCGRCGFIAYQNPKIVAATLPVKAGKIYLLRRAIEPAKGLWSHPAGYMELGETVERAAIRETREEICCGVKLVGAPKIYSYADAAVLTVVYDAVVVRGKPRPGQESLEVAAFRPAEIPWRQLAFRSTFHALRDWMRAPKKAV